MLSKKWLRERLLVAILFHWLVAIMAEVIAVSFMMLLVHLYIAHLQRPDVKLFKDRNWRGLIACEIIFLILARYGSFLSDDFAVMIAKLFWVNLFLVPIIFLMLPFLRAPQADGKLSLTLATPQWLKSSLRPRSFAEAAVGLFLVVQLLFGFAPLLMHEPYSVYNVGWGMFSGGYLQNPTHTLHLSKQPCAMFPNVPGLISLQQTETEVIYTAKRQMDLDRLKNFLEHRCAEPK